MLGPRTGWLRAESKLAVGYAPMGRARVLAGADAVVGMGAGFDALPRPEHARNDVAGNDAPGGRGRTDDRRRRPAAGSFRQAALGPRSLGARPVRRHLARRQAQQDQ